MSLPPTLQSSTGLAHGTSEHPTLNIIPKILLTHYLLRLRLPRRRHTHMSAGVLAHEFIGAKGAGAATRTCVFLHGLLGSRKNLRNAANALVRRCDDWRVMLIDLPGHGQSRAPDNHTVNHYTLSHAAEEVRVCVFVFVCVPRGGAGGGRKFPHRTFLFGERCVGYAVSDSVCEGVWWGGLGPYR